VVEPRVGSACDGGTTATRVGSKSEGPDYHLQTYHADYVLRDGERHPWQPDYCLEFFARKMIEVEGEVVDRVTIQVRSITELLSPVLPRPDGDEVNLAAAFVLRQGDCVSVFSEPVSLTFVGVVEEPRQPTDLGCASPGECTIQLRLTPDGTAGQTFALTSSAARPELATAEVLGYYVSLHGLDPGPMRDEQRPRPEQYAAKIEIDRME
jgi:hypothetical protein